MIRKARKSKDVGNVDALALEFLGDRIEVFDPSEDQPFDVVALQQALENPLNLDKPTVGGVAPFFDLVAET